MELGGLLAIIGIMSFIIIMKVLICSCYMRHQQRRAEDRRPILGDDAIERLYEIHQSRIRSRMAREPPPTFEDALRNSRPVSYIDVEEPPPTYDEYLSTNNSPSDKDSYLAYSPSANPTDTIIAMDITSINSYSIESTA